MILKQPCKLIKNLILPITQGVFLRKTINNFKELKTVVIIILYVL